jgi:penicillin-binding protein 1A
MASRSTIHELERRELRGRWFVALASLLMIGLLASTWIGLFSFLSASAAFGSFFELERRYLPDTEALLLDLPDLSQTSKVYTDDGTLLAELHDGRNSLPVRIEEVPDRVLYALLAAEDDQFYTHGGIDFAAIVSAVVDNLRGITRGGSTITQQIVKQNFVGNELTITRKLKEAVTAAELERRYDKEQILEFYLNSVYFGSSAYGLGAAALEYFDKDVRQLTIAEAATLAVQIRSPGAYDPRRFPERVERRRNDVIDNMVSNGFIAAYQGELAKRQPLVIQPRRTFQSPAPHVVAEVKRQLLNDPEFAFLGATPRERKRAIFGCPADDTTCTGGGGLRIITSLDLELQLEANRILQTWLPLPVSEEGEEVLAPTGAIAMVENETGAIKVMASGLPFDVEQFDLVTQGIRNPGSAFKPFTLVAALEAGLSLNSFWDDRTPTEVDCGYPCDDGSNIWTVRNAGGGGNGRTLYSATTASVNVVYAQVAVAIGPERIAQTAKRMGIKTELKPAYPSITLGGRSVGPLEMASAFSNFATNGLWAEPYLIDRIIDADGNVIYERDVQRRQVADPAIIAAARKPLEVIPVRGTAPRANLGIPQGGKTGTHQDFKDSWFVGFVPRYTAAVWVGFSEAQIPLRNVTINVLQDDGTYEPTLYPRVYGGTVAAPIWKEFMTQALHDLPVEDFPEDPPGVSRYFQTPLTNVPLVVGMEEEDAVDTIFDAHLRPNVVEVDSVEPAGTVVGQDPLPGEETKQGSTVLVEVSSGIPPTAPLLDLSGLSLSEVSAALVQFEQETGVALGFSVRFEETENPELVDKVIRTEPGPGAIVTYEQSIVLYVGEEPPPEEEGPGGSGPGGGGPGGGGGG